MTQILEVEFRKKKKAVGTSWRIDETYIKVKGNWRYLYRTVDKEGKTTDFLLTKKRDKKAAKRFLIKAISNTLAVKEASTLLNTKKFHTGIRLTLCNDKYKIDLENEFSETTLKKLVTTLETI